MRFSVPDRHSTPAPPWTTPAVVALAVVLVVGSVLGWLTRGDALTVYGDDSIYLTLSYSLAHGQFRDEFLFGTPPHAQYPPGMPLYLLLVRTIAGPGIAAVMVANLLLIALSAALAADGVRRLSNPGVAVAVAAVITFNPALLTLSAELRSEVPYLAWCAIALWCSLRVARAEGAWFPALALMAASAAFLTRSAGLALLPAIWWALIVDRRRRTVMAGVVVTAVLIVGWFYYTRWATAHTVGHSYAADLSDGVSVAQPVHLLSHALGNAKSYFASFAAVQFAIPDIHGQPIDNAVSGLLLVIPMLVGALWLVGRWAAVPVFLLLTALMLGVFPWPVGRLITVMLPWMTAAMMLGWLTIATRARWRNPVGIATGIGAVIATFGLVGQIRAAERRTACRATAPFVDPNCYQLQDRAYMQAIGFVRDSLPRSAILASSKPAIVYQSSGMQTFPLELFSHGPLQRLLIPAGPVSHILLGRLMPYERDLVAPALLQECSALTVRRHFTLGALLLEPRLPPEPDACSALQEYIQTTPPALGDDER